MATSLSCIIQNHCQICIFYVGEDCIYLAKDEGDCSGLVGEKELHFKVGCPVMLIVNMSDYLVNGLTGKVTKTSAESVEVFFHTINQHIEIKPFSFTKYSTKLKRDIGCRLQIPLKLSFAMTIHKCQGSTINRVDLNCKNLFQYGQLVVGLSRTPTKKGLRVTNFTKNLIKKPPQVIIDFLSRPPITIIDNLLCCVNARSSLTDEQECNENQDTCTSILAKDAGIEISSEDELEILEAIDNLEKQLTDITVAVRSTL